MKTVNFREHPSQVITWLILIVGMIMFLVAFRVMMPFFAAYPVGFIESQLSFSGEVIKNHFAQMNAEGINLYKTGQLLDYLYMVGYGSILFSGSVLSCRSYSDNTIGEKIGLIFPITGIIAALCDAIENMFILFMIANPAGFSNIIAIMHSIFAVIKFLFFISGLGYIGFSSILWLINYIQNIANNPNSQLKFLSDEMMGDVASWLRILGYDTSYAKDYEKKYNVEAKGVSVKDINLIAECFEENRILLSRDKEMVKIMGLKYQKKLNGMPTLWKNFGLKSAQALPFIYLQNTDAITRLKLIRDEFGLSMSFNPVIARCSHCNSSTHEIKNKENVRDQIPPKAYESHDHFWMCTNSECSQIYWIGSHFQDILKKIEAINTSN